MLNVQRGKNIDFGGQNLLHIFIAFAIFAAGNIGVCQFIDQHHGGFTRDDGVYIHLFENRALVLNTAPRHGFQLGG